MNVGGDEQWPDKEGPEGRGAVLGTLTSQVKPPIASWE